MSRESPIDAAGQEPPIARHTGTRVIAAATVATVLTVMPVFLFGALIVLIREDVPITDGQLGVAVSAFFLASMVSSVPGGRVADAIGPRAGMTIGAVLSVSTLLGIGLAAASWWHMAGFMFVGGVGSGVGMASSNLAVARQVTAGRRGVAFGIKQASAPIASIVAGLSIPFVGLTVGWRWALTGAAGLLLLAFLMLSADVIEKGRPVRRPQDLTAPLPALGLLAAMAGFAAAAATVTIGFFVESAEARGFATSTAGYVLSVGSAFGVVARIGWGWLADRRDSGHLAFIAWLFTIGSVGFAMLGLVESVPLLAVAAVVVFVAGWSWSGLVFLVATMGSPGAPATATGLVSAGGGLGGLLGPILFGAVVQSSSYTAAWLMTGSWMLIAAVLARVTLSVWLRLIATRDGD